MSGQFSGLIGLPDTARNVLIAGCGGGFDVYTGVPLAIGLIAEGRSVVLGNLSFSHLEDSGCRKVAATAWRVDPAAREMPYFPEKWLAEWLARRDIELPVYGLGKSGVVPLAEAYRAVIAEHAIDAVVLADGGTDSVIFGDEPGLGTVAEDAVSVVAAVAAFPDAVLSLLGFGVDHFHGVSHHSFLENVATLTRDGALLGSTSLVAGRPEADGFLSLVDYANQRQPRHRSIVCNSIASAIRGEFGDVHASERTAGTELFINPLMAQVWALRAEAVMKRMRFAAALAGSQTFEEALLAIERHRGVVTPRPRRPIPL